MATTASNGWAVTVPQGQGEELARSLSRVFSGRSKEQPPDDRDSDATISQAEDWKLMPEVRDVRNQQAQDQRKNRRLGVTWKDLTVKGIGADHAFNENVFSQFNIPKKISESRKGAPLKTIIDRSHGCVKPGEMLLVLGRPGAGTTTLLKVCQVSPNVSSLSSHTFPVRCSPTAGRAMQKLPAMSTSAP